MIVILQLQDCTLWDYIIHSTYVAIRTVTITFHTLRLPHTFPCYHRILQVTFLHARSALDAVPADWLPHHLFVAVVLPTFCYTHFTHYVVVVDIHTAHVACALRLPGSRVGTYHHVLRILYALLRTRAGSRYYTTFTRYLFIHTTAAPLHAHLTVALYTFTRAHPFALPLFRVTPHTFSLRCWTTVLTGRYIACYHRTFALLIPLRCYTCLPTTYLPHHTFGHCYHVTTRFYVLHVHLFTFTR